jgi:hypothetical protein
MRSFVVFLACLLVAGGVALLAHKMTSTPEPETAVAPVAVERPAEPEAAAPTFVAETAPAPAAEAPPEPVVPAPAEEPPAPPPPPPRYAGIVVRVADGTLLPGVVVTALAADGTQITQVVSDDGRFGFGPDITAQAPAQLQFVWRDFAALSQGASNPREVSALVDPTQLTMPPDEIRIELDTGWIARGKVVDDEGTPVTAATVMFGEAELAQSRVDGTFVVRDLDPALPSASFRVDGNGWVSASADVAAPPPGKWDSSFQVVLVRYVPPDAPREEDFPRRPGVR